MNPSRLFILRPVGTALLMLAILLAGGLAYSLLPIAALPNVDYPIIQVTTLYPGASPDVMATAVTAPLEVQFGEMPGLNQMSSSSSAGASVITLQFDLSLSIDVAEQEVQAAINAANNLLPAGLPAPPTYAKYNPAAAPILTLAATSSVLPLSTVASDVDTLVAQKLSQLPGVGLVSLSGGSTPAVRVQVNLKKLASYGINLDDLRTTIGNLTVDMPKGSFDGAARSYAIDANDQLTSARGYENAVIAYRNGAPVRLRNVATVRQGPQDAQVGAWADTTPAIILNIQRQPGANVIAVANSVKALLPNLRAALPSSIHIATIADHTVSIRASVRDVQFELVLAVALVVFTIFLFLRNLRATVIPSLSVPLSIVGTFGAMYLLGFSLDNLSLMALTVASGFVVDDAIVMIENIARYIEQGLSPRDAALRGAGEIGFTIISMTVSLIAALIPLLFMGDVVGRLFHEFAITLSVTIVISAIVSLTLVPMLSAQVLGGSQAATETRFAAASRRAVNATIGAYDRALTAVLDHQPTVLVVALGTVVLTAVLFFVIPKGFFPTQDTGEIQGITAAAQSVSYPAMVARQQALAKIILKNPNVSGLSSYVGVDGTNMTLNDGRFLITLKPRGEGRAGVAQVIAQLRRAVAKVPGIGLTMQPVQDLTLGDTVSAGQYQFVLENSDAAAFAVWVPKLLDALRKLPQLADVTSDLQQDGLAIDIDVNRARAASYGITMATVDNALYDAFGQRIISTIFTQSDQYRVILQAAPDRRSALGGLDAIYLPSALATGGPGGGGQVPLSSIAAFRIGNAPLVIQHLGQFPAASISFNLAPGISLGSAVAAIQRVERQVLLPASFITSFQGAAQSFRTTLGNEALLIVAALATVYIVLGVLYESFIHPLTILSTLPSAGVGALLALLVAGDSLDVISLIGLVLLIGIVKKNAIMMIDFAVHAERNRGLTPRAAIHEAAVLRFRPIMMTTLAALFAALPLMLGTGTGSELRSPLGVTIVGGLLLSQALTLFTTPVIYLALGRVAARLVPGVGPAPEAAE